MLGLPRSFRIAAGSVLVLGLASATAACGAPGTPTNCTPGDDMIAQRAVVHYAESDELGYLVFLLECTSDGTVTVFDEDGNDYESLEDFQANNDLLTEEDRILLPSHFPSMSGSDESKIVTVPGHTGNSAMWWRIGAAVLVVIIALIAIPRLREQARIRAGGAEAPGGGSRFRGWPRSRFERDHGSGSDPAP
jgi:hypothetical protein